MNRAAKCAKVAKRIGSICILGDLGALGGSITFSPLAVSEASREPTGVTALHRPTLHLAKT
jgi:hypothetical protein